MLIGYQGSASDVLPIFTGLQKFADDCFVTLQLEPVNMALAMTELHSVNPLYYHHVQNMARRGLVIKSNPLDLIKPHAVSKKEDVTSYVRLKMRKLFNSLIEFSTSSTINDAHLDMPEYLKFIQGLLETPIHLARKILEALGTSLENDDKNGVLQAYREFASIEDANLLTKIMYLNELYNAIIEDQLRQPDKNIYGAALAKIHDSGFEVFDYFERSAHFLAS